MVEKFWIFVYMKLFKYSVNGNVIKFRKLKYLWIDVMYAIPILMWAIDVCRFKIKASPTGEFF